MVKAPLSYLVALSRVRGLKLIDNDFCQNVGQSHSHECVD